VAVFYIFSDAALARRPDVLNPSPLIASWRGLEPSRAVEIYFRKQWRHWVFERANSSSFREQINMATAQHSAVDQIGDTAGLVWHHLNESGPRTLTQLVKEVDAPRDVLMQAIGWLAREDKLSFEEARGKTIVTLRS
jgi:hypothetical protein